MSISWSELKLLSHVITHFTPESDFFAEFLSVNLIFWVFFRIHEWALFCEL